MAQQDHSKGELKVTKPTGVPLSSPNPIGVPLKRQECTAFMEVEQNTIKEGEKGKEGKTQKTCGVVRGV